MGINNTFSYKGFTLSFLIDIRQGGSLYSETVGSYVLPDLLLKLLLIEKMRRLLNRESSYNLMELTELMMCRLKVCKIIGACGKIK